MLFKNALLKIKDEKLLDEIIDFSYSTIYSHFLEPIDKDKLKSNISKEINSLLSLESKPTSIEHIVCIRTLEDEAEIDDSGHYVITPDVKYHEIYDVWLTQKGDGEHYSLLFADQREVLNADVLDRCITRYGFITVMANVLYELSWNGYEYETVNKNQEKMIKDLENSQKEIDEHPENLKDFNEIRKELGMPEHTREEKEFIRRIHEYISDEYEKEMKVILGFEKQKHE